MAFHMVMELEDGPMGTYIKDSIKLDIKMELEHLSQFNRVGSIWEIGY